MDAIYKENGCIFNKELQRLMDRTVEIAGAVRCPVKYGNLYRGKKESIYFYRNSKIYVIIKKGVNDMVRTLDAIFDGKVLHPDIPLDLIPNTKVKITIELPYESNTTSYITAEELLRSELIGLWKDRKDISDSSDYARQLREKAQKRSI